jgi:hypothetical protein
MGASGDEGTNAVGRAMPPWKCPTTTGGWSDLRSGEAAAMAVGPSSLAGVREQATAVQAFPRWRMGPVHGRSYSIPNGPPGPSTARARFGPALSGTTAE